jgi:FixJ family two-component response regulator
MNEPVVHIVDDDEWHVAALSRLLQLHGLAIRTHGRAAAFLASLKPGMRGCVVADLCLPDMSGLDLQARLAVSSAPMPLIFLTGQGDIPCSVLAMRNGAVDFLEKRVPAEVVIRSVRLALEQDELQALERARLCEINARFARLTAREREVLRHMVEGRMIKEIAAVLRINERTVKLHRTAITRKTGVHSPALLALFAREAGLFGSDHLPALERLRTNLPFREVAPLALGR